MGKAKASKGLGKGLSALLGDAPPDIEAPAAAGKAEKRLPIEFIRPNPDQPRKHFDEQALAELSDSIAEKGVLQPILVRPVEGDPDTYEIVAGERRWRAGATSPGA